ncbi:MAG: hypothetical protein NWF09_09615 [Candidatus Bathyarchaeota archaeon]|nr:hypothetical protein [Candidatus Bathyarchaeota archaeon]
MDEEVTIVSNCFGNIDGSALKCNTCIIRNQCLLKSAEIAFKVIDVLTSANVCVLRGMLRAP